jgi:protein phosphatase 1D
MTDENIIGIASTAGTTASVAFIAFIRYGKINIGHVGDSGIILGYQQNERNVKFWVAEPLTQDRKPNVSANRHVSTIQAGR